MKNFRFLVTALVCHFAAIACLAQDPTLHINPKWRECSFQIDPSLTQSAWHEFANEAGYVAYFRPLTDAKAMGRGKNEFSLLQWQTGINPAKDAWNNTFVHPNATHWLVEGPRLPIPGITYRRGITDKLDAGVYWTKSIGANYGFFGGQIQYNLIDNVEKKWSAAARASFVSIYGPQDLNFSIAGVDLITSKEFALYSNWLSVAPYVGVSARLSNAHEKTAAVNLKDAHVMGAQAMAGAVAKISIVRLAVEYNAAKVNTFSFKLGVVF